MQNGLIFMAGCQSSGTTIMARILHEHRAANFGVEDGKFRHLIIWSWSLRGNQSKIRYARFGDLIAMIDAVRPGRPEIVSRYRAVVTACLKSDRFQELLDRNAVLPKIRFIAKRYYRPGPGSTLWDDKYPEYVFQHTNLFALYSNARFIFIVQITATVIAFLVRQGFVAVDDNTHKSILTFIGRIIGTVGINGSIGTRLFSILQTLLRTARIRCCAMKMQW